ncbi:DNA ligase 1-like [Ambystoma mexicanum]|uniref:DNA ligase 1-like n=1 Tax=Ambystoma mexicanum TaxID=8296 RepID=UPI0037E80C3F
MSKTSKDKPLEEVTTTQGSSKEEQPKLKPLKKGQSKPRGPMRNRDEEKDYKDNRPENNKQNLEQKPGSKSKDPSPAAHNNVKDLQESGQTLLNKQTLAKENKSLKPQHIQRKLKNTVNTNELMTKWITVVDKKSSNKENGPQQKSDKRESYDVFEESTIDLSNISVYSKENSDSEIPSPTAKKRKVSFADDKCSSQGSMQNQHKDQTAYPKKLQKNTHEKRNERHWITPER